MDTPKKSNNPLILSNGLRAKQQKNSEKESNPQYSLPPPLDESLEGLVLEGRKKKKLTPPY